jgi:type VI protein secretion system component VasF
MRANNGESLSRRRARRPDGLVYRQTRRISNGRRGHGVPAWVWIALFVFIALVGLILWRWG